MNKEKIENEIARIDHALEMYVREVKRLAENMLNYDARQISFFTVSQSIAQNEREIQKLLARKEAFNDILSSMK